MNSKLVIVTITFSTIFGFVVNIGDEDIRCVANSCDNPVCDEVPAKCTTNETDAAIFMLSPDICNCCEYCLVNLAEGEACSVGQPSNAKHTSICGPGLSCVVSEDENADGTCQKMSTPCALKQQSFDTRKENGLLGTMETRATCDDDGFYGIYKCIPGQTCHCLHTNGTRIFGEANYNTISNYMTCACSRAYYDAVDIVGRHLHPHEHFRCAVDGSYDRLQCINGKCLCVDSSDGAPTYPDEDLVDMEDIDKYSLPCYSSQTPGQYYKKCEEAYMKMHDEVERKKNESSYSLILGYVYPDCDLDGTYSPVQENSTHKYCVGVEGDILTKALNKTDSALATLIANMDCKCARANIIMTTSDKPDCLENGNYNPMQCRRGICRCVDADGNQKCSSATKECDEVEESQSSTMNCSF